MNYLNFVFHEKLITSAVHYDSLRSEKMNGPVETNFHAAKHELKFAVLANPSEAALFNGAKKAKNKIAEWLGKYSGSDEQFQTECTFQSAVSQFLETYQQSLESPQLQSVRRAKKEYKEQVFRTFGLGFTPEYVQAILKSQGTISEKTIKKVQYWGEKKYEKEHWTYAWQHPSSSNIALMIYQAFDPVLFT